MSQSLTFEGHVFIAALNGYCANMAGDFTDDEVAAERAVAFAHLVVVEVRKSVQAGAFVPQPVSDSPPE